MHSLGRILLAFALLHFVLQGQTCLYSRHLLTSCFCIPIPMVNRIGIIFFFFFLILFLRGLPGLIELISFFGISGWGIYLNYCDVESSAWKWTKIILSFLRLHPKYSILDSFVDYEGYSISSKGFLLTVVDVIVIEFCQENALVTKSTLFQQHKRRFYTWTSPGGQY